MVLEELGTFTWMLIAACVVLFVANLPGGMIVLAIVTSGIVFLTSARAAYQRALAGPQRKLDPQLALRGAARQLVQGKLMREAFGGSSCAQAGRKIEEVEIAPQRRWLLVQDSQVRAVLFELRDEGFFLCRGELLCSDLAPGQALPRLWRIELLPQTGRILSWSGLGGDAPVRELACDALASEWLSSRLEFGAINLGELPPSLARGLGMHATPYRN